MQGLKTVAPNLPVPWVLPFSSSVPTFCWNLTRSPIIIFIIPQGIFLHLCHVLRIKSSCWEDRVMTISFSLQNGIPGFLADLEDACLRYQRRTYERFGSFLFMNDVPGSAATSAAQHVCHFSISEACTLSSTLCPRVPAWCLASFPILPTLRCTALFHCRMWVRFGKPLKKDSEVFLDGLTKMLQRHTILNQEHRNLFLYIIYFLIER